MNLHRLNTRGAATLLLCAATALVARADEQSVPFSDPGSPGKVVIQMGLGDLHVVGADVTEVKVVSSEKLEGNSGPRPDGLRRLDSGGGHGIVREGNVITIGASSMFGGEDGGPADLTVTVPVGTSIVVNRLGPGETALEKLSGDVEIHAAIGDISLEALSGGAVVEAVNGDIHAAFSGLSDDHPVSISSVRGDVELRVPGSAKADVRFRTLRGEILTDFGDELKTNMENSWTDDEAGAVAPDKARAEQDREQARMAERQARDEARRARAEAKRMAAQQGQNRDGAQPMPPMPPMPMIPHIPPMAGGRVVSGTLNEGGTDISVTTLNGEIRFRKAE